MFRTRKKGGMTRAEKAMGTEWGVGVGRMRPVGQALGA